VIHNVAWTNSWLSIAGAGCGLIGAGAGGEQEQKVNAVEVSRCVEDKKAWFERPGSQRDQVWVAWWQEQQDDVMIGSLVESQSQDRGGTTWGPSHEWRLVGGHIKSVRFPVVHHKTTRFLG
jgi:hypothetical protein